MIAQNVRQILEELPPGVLLVAAAKGRTPEEIRQVIAAGVEIIGENYAQQAHTAFAEIGRDARWHMIGHLQRNKVRQAVNIFDMIETVDSVRLAESIEGLCARAGRTMPVLIEINSGREPQKYGVLPEQTEELIRQISRLEHVAVQGLMTMGPRFGDPEDARPYFRESKRLFDHLRGLRIPNVELRYLSMGMSNSFKVAIQEGANIVRIGTMIFGERQGKP